MECFANLEKSLHGILYNLTWYLPARNTNTIVGKSSANRSQVSFTFSLLLPLSLSSPSSPSRFFLLCFSPSVSQTIASDSFIWEAYTVFYAEYWLSNLVCLVNAASLWKILINSIPFSNPSHTLRFAMLCETISVKCAYTCADLKTHSLAGTSSDIHVVFLWAFLFTAVP